MRGNMTTGGDLGRRVARRRGELGLTIEQLADRVQMSARYLEYLEGHAAIAGIDTLLRLADGLEISLSDLLGEHADWPSGHATPGPRPSLTLLTEAECRHLIDPGGIGRVVFMTDHGPQAIPVNYAIFNGEIVFRTGVGGVLAGLAGTEVGFEIDKIDEALAEGWSVLVAGKVTRIDHPAMLSRVRELVRPWPGDDRHVCLRIDPAQVTGRRVHAT